MMAVIIMKVSTNRIVYIPQSNYLVTSGAMSIYVPTYDTSYLIIDEITLLASKASANCAFVLNSH